MIICISELITYLNHIMCSLHIAFHVHVHVSVRFQVSYHIQVSCLFHMAFQILELSSSKGVFGYLESERKKREKRENESKK